MSRVIWMVIDSVGIGALPDSQKFGDVNVDTLGNIVRACKGIKIPNMIKLGLANIEGVDSLENIESPIGCYGRCSEVSKGKDTTTGHWEMTGVLVETPFKTFDNGFPKDIIEEFERRSNRKVIGNKPASGTAILDELGEQHMNTGEVIVYTSADSVFQIAAHEEIVSLDELYKMCEIAREICMKPEWLLGRIIARPYVGEDASSFKRTSNRHDLALSPTDTTAMDILKENNYDVVCVGKIADIFNNCGVTQSVKTVSNIDGMEKTIDIAKNDNFEGLCFVNLVEFDSEFGHRRNALGYGKAFETFDGQLGELLNCLGEDDLLMITADHGNDPTAPGSDHTREQVPLLCYSKKFTQGTNLEPRTSFGDIGATILENFGLQKTESQIGETINELLD